MATLASLDDLESYLGRTLDAVAADQALLHLELASDAARAYTRQRLNLETTTAQLRAGCGPLILPERPVVSVDEISIDGTVFAAAGYRVVRDTVHWGTWPINVSANRPWAPELVVDVEYTHGFAVVPGDIRSVVLSAAARAVETLTGVKQETIGAYSVTYGGADGGVVLLELERKTLDRYRRRTW